MAIGNSVGDEIREERRKAMGRMSPKEKFAYFWDYYKIHAFVTVAVVIAASSFIYQYATYKDYGFYAALINAGVNDVSAALPETWADEFQAYAEIDPDEYEVYIDTSMTLSDTDLSQYTMANQQKMAAMMQTGSLSTIVAETATFEKYAQAEYFCPLEDVLSAEELEKYRPYFYYTDTATFPDDDYDPTEVRDLSVLTIDHSDPSTMEDPVAVGIIVTEDNALADAGLYAYLADSKYDYQGHPADVVLGIPVSNSQPELVVKFLAYLQLGEQGL